MEEQWQYRITDAFRKLVEFIKTNNGSAPYDPVVAEFINAEQLLSKTDKIELSRAMKGVVTGSTIVDGKACSNIRLMAGMDTDKSGFYYTTDDKRTISGTFMKAPWSFRFNGKRFDQDGKETIVPCEIKIRSLVDVLTSRYKEIESLKNELISAWFYSVFCIALAFSDYIIKYCTEEVSEADRNMIRDRIPKDCANVQRLNKGANLANIFKLINNITKNDYTKSFIEGMGVDPKGVEHFVTMARDNFHTIKVDDIKSKVMDAAQTGEIDGLGPILKELVSTVSHFMPSIDQSNPSEQD